MAPRERHRSRDPRERAARAAKRAAYAQSLAQPGMPGLTATVVEGVTADDLAPTSARGGDHRAADACRDGGGRDSHSHSPGRRPRSRAEATEALAGGEDDEEDPMMRTL